MTLVTVEYAHTASQGRHVRLHLSEDAYDALRAAIEVAYDEIEHVPDEFAAAGSVLWDRIVSPQPNS